jgi:tape measure domain-containing protein
MPASDVIVRLRLAGQAAFLSGTQAAARGVDSIGKSTMQTDKHATKFGKTIGGLGATLAPLSTAAGVGFAGLGVAIGGAVKQGIDFNANMQQSRTAFTNLLGSSSEAQAMLDRLYNVAAKTPFEFPQLVQSTQRLLGFGMAAKDVEPTMRAVGDAVAASGGGAEQIDRVSTALGQMQAKGKVSSEELMQLSESGVPALKLLQDELGLTGTQLSSQLQKGAIGADKGIAALVAGMNKRYGGMAVAQSKTFSGMLSTLKDNVSQTLGAMTGPLFGALSTKVLPKVNDIAGAIQKWAQGGGVTVAINALRAGFAGGGASETAGFAGALGKVVEVGRVFGTVWRAIRGAVTQLFDALKPMQPFLQNILFPLLKGIAIGVLGSVIAAFKLLIPVIRIVATALGWIGQKAAPLRGVFEKVGIVIGVIVGPAILRMASLLGKLGFVFKIVAGAARVMAVPLRILGALMGRLIGVVGKLFGVLGRIGGVGKRAADALLRPFKRLGKAFLELGKSIITAIGEGIKASAGVVMEALKSILPGGKVGSLIRKAIPGLQHGGVTSSRGSVIVGEVGPELLQLPGGARVTPLPRMSLQRPPALAGAVATTAHFYLDRRLVATAVARDTADRKARR